MSQISVQKPGALGDNAAAAAYQTQNQVNLSPGVRNVTTALPRTWNAGDLAVSVKNGFVNIYVGAAKGTHHNVAIPTVFDYGYLSLQSGSGAPTSADFPAEGNYGFYYNTASSDTWFTINSGSGMLTPSLGTLSGLLSFSQVASSPSITAAQHGDFASTAANDNLHAIATTARPGFMSAAAFALVDGAAVGAQNDTLVKRSGSASISAVNFLSSGTKVLGNRIVWSGTPSGSIDRTDFTTYNGGYFDTAAATYDAAQIESLMAQMTEVTNALVDNSQHLGAIIRDCQTHGFISA